MKIIDIYTKMIAGMPFPRRIKTHDGQVWTYVEGFGQYQNDNYQELIKYMSGYYCKFESGMTYPAIFSYEVEVEDES